VLCAERACPAGGNQREQAREKNQKKLQELAKGKQKESASSLAKRREACVAPAALLCMDTDSQSIDAGTQTRYARSRQR
jgi:hypothetical protein